MNKQHIHQIPRYRALLNTFRFVRDPIGLINESLERFGSTFYTYVGGLHHGIVTTDPGFIQHVLQKNNRNYLKSPMHFDKVSHFLGNGLLTSEGDYWLRQRRLIQPGFHRAKLEALTVIMQQVIDRFVERFDAEVATEKPIDIGQRMMEVAFSVVANSLFSTNIAESELGRLSQLLTQIQEFIIRQIRQPYLIWWFHLSGEMRRHEKMAAEFQQIVFDIIKSRRSSTEQHDDLMQMLLDARYEDTGEGMTDAQLFAESAIMFVAGHETSANALAWTWYLLAQHPKIVTKARTELDEVLGNRTPTFEDLPKLTYLTQIIEESMRLYPPAWLTDRIAAQNDEFKGIKIPKGSIVVTYFYGTHHAADLWENPEQFNPDRFAKDKKKQQPPFAYVPFGGGPRLCIGNSFAIMEMQLILSAMLRRYDFALLPDQQVDMQPLITLRPKSEIWMAWKRK